MLDLQDKHAEDALAPSFERGSINLCSPSLCDEDRHLDGMLSRDAACSGRSSIEGQNLADSGECFHGRKETFDLLMSKTDGWGASRPGFWDPSAWESGSVASNQEGLSPKESRSAEHGDMLPRRCGPSFYRVHPAPIYTPLCCPLSGLVPH